MLMCREDCLGGGCGVEKRENKKAAAGQKIKGAGFLQAKPSLELRAADWINFFFRLQGMQSYSGLRWQ